MSVYFLANERELWNPGVLTARFFCDAVASISQILRIESGLGPILSDEVHVDPVRLHAFALALLNFLNRDPASAIGVLLSGTCAIVLALDVAATKGEGPIATDPNLLEYLQVGQAAIGQRTTTGRPADPSRDRADPSQDDLRDRKT